jgi:hypothetical protein
MLFNIVYVCAPHMTILRRDFISLTKFSLEACGHEVTVSYDVFNPRAMNLVIRGYAPEVSQYLLAQGDNFPFAILNTEVIVGGKLNFFVNQTDYKKNYQYEEVMRRAKFVWEVIYDNMERHKEIGTKAFFYRWGYHPKLDEITHLREKDFDYFFFGSDSPRRRELIDSFDKAALRGGWDQYSPYFIRNSGVARAKLQLNLISHDVFTHVNSFRIAYLAGNRCAIISEPEHDPVGYMDYVVVSPREALIDTIREYAADNKYQKLADRSYELFRQTDANQIMHELLAQTKISA